jgi:hypothetical protein
MTIKKKLFLIWKKNWKYTIKFERNNEKVNSSRWWIRCG